MLGTTRTSTTLAVVVAAAATVFLGIVLHATNSNDHSELLVSAFQPLNNYVYSSSLPTTTPIVSNSYSSSSLSKIKSSSSSLLLYHDRQFQQRRKSFASSGGFMTFTATTTTPKSTTSQLRSTPEGFIIDVDGDDDDNDDEEDDIEKEIAFVVLGDEDIGDLFQEANVVEDDDEDEEEDDDDSTKLDPYMQVASSEFQNDNKTQQRTSSSSSSSLSSALTINSGLDTTNVDWGGALSRLRERVEDVETGKSQDPSHVLFRMMSAQTPNQVIGQFVSSANPQVVQAMSGAISSLLGGLSNPNMGVEMIVKASGEKIGSLCFQLQMTGKWRGEGGAHFKQIQTTRFIGMIWQCHDVCFWPVIASHYWSHHDHLVFINCVVILITTIFPLSLAFSLYTTPHISLGYMFRNAEYVIALKDLMNLKGRRLTLDDYKDAFNKLDTDDSGYIEVTEIQDLFKDVYDDGKVPSFEVSAFLEFFDKNKDGKISWEEFEKGLGAAIATAQSTKGDVASRLLGYNSSDDDDEDDDDVIDVNTNVSGTIQIEMEDGKVVEVDAREYMENLKAEAQKLKDALRKEQQLLSGGVDGRNDPSSGLLPNGGGGGGGADIAGYIASRQGDVRSLTEGISPEVVDTMRKLVDFVLEGGEKTKSSTKNKSNKNSRSSPTDKEKAEMEMEIPGSALQQLALWQLVLGYRLREEEVKGDYTKLLKG
jgi:hypothetical protein